MYLARLFICVSFIFGEKSSRIVTAAATVVAGNHLGRQWRHANDLKMSTSVHASNGGAAAGNIISSLCGQFSRPILSFPLQWQ